MTGPAGYRRGDAAAEFIGCSARQFYRYRALGWIVPDRFLPSTTGGRPVPLYSEATLQRFLDDVIDPKCRKFTTETGRAA